MRPSVKKPMQQAYRARNAKTAKRLLTNLLQRFCGEHPGAAGSDQSSSLRTASSLAGLSANSARVREHPSEHLRELVRKGPLLPPARELDCDGKRRFD